MKKIFLIFFIFSSIYCQALENYNWQPHESNLSDVNILIGGKSKDDFWFVDNSNQLKHYSNGNNKSFNLFVSGTTKFIKYHFFNDFLIALHIDQTWHTTVIKITSTDIINYGIISDVPLYMAQEYNNGILLAGDFGSLICMDGDKFSSIETDIDAHIRSILQTKDNKILLALSDGGATLYDGNQFTQLMFESNAPILLKGFYQNKDGKIIAKSDKNDIFVLTDSTFVKVMNDLFFPDYTINNNRFVINVYNKYNGKEETVELPPLSHLKSFCEFESGQYCYSNKAGKVFYNSRDSKPIFVDYTESLGITTGPVLYSLDFKLLTSTHPSTNPAISCLSCADINNDGWVDFILPDGQIPIRPNIFLNNKGNFLDKKNWTEQTEPELDGSFFWTGDLDNDNELEFIFNHWSDSSYTGEIAIEEDDQLVYKNIFSLPIEYSSRNMHSISYCDFNADGLLDLFVTSSYGKSAEKGVLFYYQNLGNFDFRRVNHIWEDHTVGWNQSTITADLDNNNSTDIFILRNWSNDLIILNDGDNYSYKSVVYDNEEKNQRKVKASFIDFDNDGDLDLLSLVAGYRLILFRNDGNGNFRESAGALSDIQNIFPQTINYYTTGDFNNDGFIDIFISSSNLQIKQNHLLLNKNGVRFKLSDNQWLKNSDGIELCNTADLDNDGDLDIFGFNKERYFFLTNTTDNKDYVKIKIQGMSSNSKGIGSKVWIYENLSNNKQKLIGYKQIGAEHFDYFSQSLAPLHFGVPEGKSISIRVLFPNGNERVVKGITSPAVVTVNEYAGIYGEVFTLYKFLNKFVQKNILTYKFLLFLLSIVITFGAIYTGKYYFEWRKLSAIAIFITSIVLYLLTSLYTTNNFMLGIYSSLAAVLLFLLLTLLFSFWLNTSFSKKTVEDKNMELLDTILNFVHGQWASSNLISLQTLSSNYSQVEKDEEFYDTLAKREKTYLETVRPLISGMIKKMSILPGQIVDKNSFTKTFSEINRILQEENTDYKALANQIEYLRTGIAQIRETQIKKYSLDPAAIINNIINEYWGMIHEDTIEYKLNMEPAHPYNVLCNAEDFAFVVDNCISNSLKGLKKQTGQKELFITILDFSSRIQIQVHDNGCGIAGKEKVFTAGYSEFGGTGMGLSTSIQKLDRFKGRIFLQSSTPLKDTTFVIELIKGI